MTTTKESGPVNGGHQDSARKLALNIQRANPQSRLELPFSPEVGKFYLPEDPHRRRLVEEWNRKPRVLTPYDPGVYPTGEDYPGGVLLTMDTIDGEQVMDSFETPWCRATVDTLFAGKKGPRILFEAGAGELITAEMAHYKMLGEGGGVHYIAEANYQIYRDALKWAADLRKQMRSRAYNPPLDIVVVHGDADTVMLKFPYRSIDFYLGDTHHQEKSDRGKDNLHHLQEKSLRIKPDGRMAACLFHLDDQMEPDQEQRALLYSKEGPIFKGGYSYFTVEAKTPPHIKYQKGPKSHLLVFIGYNSPEDPRSPAHATYLSRS